MKPASIFILFILFLSPIFVLGQETIETSRVRATIEDKGDWELTDSAVGITWHGQWIASHLMKVTGSDNSCFVIGENETGMVQLDCKNLHQISILLSYQG